jgi:dodecin
VQQVEPGNGQKETHMATDVFKGITIVGISNESFSDAIKNAIERSTETIRELRWFEVREQRGAVREGKIEYQVSIEVFFKLTNDGGD